MIFTALPARILHCPRFALVEFFGKEEKISWEKALQLPPYLAEIRKGEGMRREQHRDTISKERRAKS